VIQVGPLEHMKPEDFENAMATHFWGPFHMMDACAPMMRRRGLSAASEPEVESTSPAAPVSRRKCRRGMWVMHGL